jgi:hypothetical protein
MKLERQGMRAHGVMTAGVELLEPRIVVVHALESVLEPEPLRQRAGQGALSGAYHASDSN